MYEDDAIQLVLSGRFNELTLDDLWMLKDVLQNSVNPQAKQAFAVLESSPVYQSLVQNTQQAIPSINENFAAIEKVESRFDLFAVTKNGELADRDIFSIFKIYNRMDIKESAADDAHAVKAGPVEKLPEAGMQPEKAEKTVVREVRSEETVKDMPKSETVPVVAAVKEPEFEKITSVEAFEAAKVLARQEVRDEFAVSKFAKLPEKEQEAEYKRVVLMSLEENAFVMVSKQLEDNLAAKKGYKEELLPQEKAKVQSDAVQRISVMVSEEEQKTPLKVTSKTVFATINEGLTRIAKKAEVLKENTGIKTWSKDVAVSNRFMRQKFPKLYDWFKSADDNGRPNLLNPVNSLTYGVTNLRKAVRNISRFAKSEEMGFFAFLRKHPKQIAVLGTSVAVSVAATYSAIASQAALLGAGMAAATIAGYSAAKAKIENKTESKDKVVAGREALTGKNKVSSKTADRYSRNTGSSEVQKNVANQKYKLTYDDDLTADARKARTIVSSDFQKWNEAYNNIKGNRRE